MTATRVYAAGGLLLLLVSPLWALVTALKLNDESSWFIIYFRLQADEWGRWLGVLAIALAVLQGFVAESERTKATIAGVFLLGAVLVPYGVARGGVDGDLSPVYVAGICLVAGALISNLFGVLRFRGSLSSTSKSAE